MDASLDRTFYHIYVKFYCWGDEYLSEIKNKSEKISFYFSFHKG